MSLVYDRPEFTDAERKNIVLHLLALDHHQTHQRKNRSDNRRVRDSLTERMQLIESAQEWVKEL